MRFPTIKAIKPGFLRIGFSKNEHGFALLFLESKEYEEPGTTKEENEESLKDLKPLFAFEVSNAEQAETIGKSIIDFAKRIKELEKEDKNDNENAGSGSES